MYRIHSFVLMKLHLSLISRQLQVPGESSPTLVGSA